MNVLVFAPHPDDEVLGCGGTMAKYTANGHHVYVCIATCGHPSIFDDSPMKLNGWPHSVYPEIHEAHSLLGVKETFYLDLPASDIESVKRFVINEKLIDLIQNVKPDIVFIPHFGDMQKDHTFLAEAVMVAVRPKYRHKIQSVYSYATLSETEWNAPNIKNVFIPNVFVDINSYLDKKIDAMKCFTSQLALFPDPRSLEAIEALAKFRGSTMMENSAEAFMLNRTYIRGGSLDSEAVASFERAAA